MKRKTGREQAPGPTLKIKPKSTPGSNLSREAFLRQLPKYKGEDDPFIVMGKALRKSAAPRGRPKWKSKAGYHKPERFAITETEEFPDQDAFSVESGVRLRSTSSPPPAFSDYEGFMDSIDDEESELDSIPPEPEFRGSPQPLKKADSSRLSSINSEAAHTANLRTIFDKLITYKTCPASEQEQLKLTIFRELEHGTPASITGLLKRTGFPQTIKDNFGRAPIHILAERAGTKGLQAIFGAVKQVNLEVKNARGDTAMHICAFEGNNEGISLLAKKGAKLDAKNNAKQTPLMLAALDEQRKTAKKLIGLGADPTLKDVGKKTAADYAELVGDAVLSKYLREQITLWEQKH